MYTCQHSKWCSSIGSKHKYCLCVCVCVKHRPTCHMNPAFGRRYPYNSFILYIVTNEKRFCRTAFYSYFLLMLDMHKSFIGWCSSESFTTTDGEHTIYTLYYSIQTYNKFDVENALFWVKCFVVFFMIFISIITIWQISRSFALIWSDEEKKKTIIISGGDIRQIKKKWCFADG